MMVVVGGGILMEDTIWVSSKGRMAPIVKDAKRLFFRVIKETLDVVVKY